MALREESSFEDPSKKLFSWRWVVTWNGVRTVVTWRWAIASGSRSLTSTSIIGRRGRCGWISSCVGSGWHVSADAPLLRGYQERRGRWTSKASLVLQGWGPIRQGGFPCSKGVVEEEEKVVTVSKKGKAPKLTDEGHPIDSSCPVS
uniref:Uncharacterized protein n=1 Tax=Fagus sylvatica TaxID=28930 RepID=A0A2N9I3J0_FAGSY